MSLHPIEYNLSFLDLMLEEFEDYILTSEVFWPLSKSKIGKTLLPRLTLGGLMLTLDELAAQRHRMNRKQSAHYERLLRTFDRLSQKWRVGMESKASQELKARITIWQAYLQDVEEQPRLIEDYPWEVRTRVMISHLTEILRSTPDIETQIQTINALDQHMNEFIVPGKFLWDDPLQQVYPEEKFPYLYRKPRSNLI